MTHLFRCHFYNVGLAQIKRDHLLAKVLAHFDFDRVHKCAPTPIIFARSEYEFLARVPAMDGKRSAAGELSAPPFGDAIARQRQYCRKIGSRGVALHHECFSRGENFPFRICGTQRSRY